LAFRLFYKESVTKDLRRIDRAQVSRVLTAIEKKLMADPLGAGKALTGEFQGLYRVRVGDYRVIYAVTGTDVIVLRIAHRREVYR
jgi:mRNA interferase RelE/StbE